MDAWALLRLQMEWGADEALDDEPVDRLASAARSPAADAPTVSATTMQPGSATRPFRSPEPPSGPSPGLAPVGTPPAVPAPGTMPGRAAEAARTADTIEALRAVVAAFDGCPLRDTATNTVFAAGSPNAGVLLVGDPPGTEEDRSATPFAGAQGALLDRMLASIGLDRSGLLLTPLIPWRPPGERPPTPSELATCLPFLHRLIALAETRHILMFGTLAARSLMGMSPRRKADIQWQECLIPGLSSPVQAIVLPSLPLMMKTPSLRRDAWKGLRLLRRAIP